MHTKKPSPGRRILESARQALAFAQHEQNHGCRVHVPVETVTD